MSSTKKDNNKIITLYMGRYKDIMMEEEEQQICNPFGHVSNRTVGYNLLGNSLIKEYFNINAKKGICSYTSNPDLVLPLKDVVEFIYEIILRYYVDAKDAGLGWSSGFDKENADDGYGQNPNTDFHCEQGGYILPPGKTIHEDIYTLLMSNGFKCFNMELYSDIVDAIGEINLVEKDPYGATDDEVEIIDWHDLCKKAKHLTKIGRSFDYIINSEKSRLFKLISNIQTARYPLFVCRNLTLYRAVSYKSPIAAPIPFGYVTSAPIQFANPGRMNRQGDSMFYGASNQTTAIIEACNDHTKPHIYIGKFKTRHPLHLLDLTGIKQVISIFEQDEYSYYTLLFLSYFCHDISRDIDGSLLEYVPTQLVTYYFRKTLKHYLSSENKVPIDGILYNSAKNGTTNAVLFYGNQDSQSHLELIECAYYINNQYQGLLSTAI